MWIVQEAARRFDDKGHALILAAVMTNRTISRLTDGSPVRDFFKLSHDPKREVGRRYTRRRPQEAFARGLGGGVFRSTMQVEADLATRRDFSSVTSHST